MPKKVSTNQVTSFLKWNLDIQVKFTRYLTYYCALYENLVIISGFFDCLLQHKQEYKIANKDIYNFNETGFQIGIAIIAKVIYSSDYLEKPSLIQLGNREQMIMVECIGSTSKIVPLLIIFKSSSNQVE